MCLINCSVAMRFRSAARNLSRSLVAFLGGVLVACTAVAQNSSEDPALEAAAMRALTESRAKWEREWPRLKDEEWPALQRSAGEAKRGVVLSLRQVRDKRAGPSSVRLLFQVKNISDRSVRVWRSNYTPDLALWIQDGAGKQVVMTKDGFEYYEPRGRIGGGAYQELEPGHTRADIYPLVKKHFVLKVPEVYTIIGAIPDDYVPFGPIDCVREPKDRLVSKPLTLNLTGGKRTQDSMERRAGDSIRPRSANSQSAAGKEWTELTRNAGQLLNGCVLEAILSPISPGNLIVSLCYHDFDRYSASRSWEQYITIPMTGSVVEDYRVFVRDPKGAVAPMAVQLSDMPHKSDNVGKDDKATTCLPFGSGIGAVIPMKRWISAAKPGEYTILVTLPSREANGPTWVAEPITIQVGKGSGSSKENAAQKK